MKRVSQSTCPNGHKPPMVQHLKDEGVYVCTKCALTWKRVVVMYENEVLSAREGKAE